MFCIGSGIIHDNNVIEDQERLTVRRYLQLWREAQKVFKDLWLKGISLYNLFLMLNGLVERLLGAHEGCPTRQIGLQGNSDVSQDSLRHCCRHLYCQLDFFLLRFPHYLLQQSVAVGVFSCPEDKLLCRDAGYKGNRTAKPVTKQTVPVVFVLQRQGLCPLVDVALIVLEVLSFFPVKHIGNVLFLHPCSAEWVLCDWQYISQIILRESI
jgi:hypothetical protein